MSTWRFYLLIVHKLTKSADMGGTGCKCHQHVLRLPMIPTLPVQQGEILLLPAQGRESRLWALNLQWQWELVQLRLPALCPRDVPWLCFPMWRAQSVWCDTLTAWCWSSTCMASLRRALTSTHDSSEYTLSTTLFILTVCNCTKGGSRINNSSNTFSLACHCSSMIQTASNDRLEKWPGLVKCGNGKASECWQVLISSSIVISATKWQQSCAKLGGKGVYTKKDQ